MNCRKGKKKEGEVKVEAGSETVWGSPGRAAQSWDVEREAEIKRSECRGELPCGFGAGQSGKTRVRKVTIFRTSGGKTMGCDRSVTPVWKGRGEKERKKMVPW